MSRDSKRELWIARMAEFAASGLSQREWCRRNQVPLPQFTYWRRALSQQETVSQGLAPVGAPGWCHWQLPQAPEPASVSSGIAIQAGGASIEVHPGFDARLLRDVVRALCGGDEL